MCVQWKWQGTELMCAWWKWQGEELMPEMARQKVEPTPEGAGRKGQKADLAPESAGRKWIGAAQEERTDRSSLCMMKWIFRRRRKTGYEI